MKSRSLKVIRLVVFCTALFSLSSTIALAAPQDPPTDSIVDVKLPDALRANLEKLQGKSVTLRVAGGEELSGTVSAVGPSAVQLSKLSGKEFYDALIPLEKVVAVVVRAR